MSKPLHKRIPAIWYAIAFVVVSLSIMAAMIVSFQHDNKKSAATITSVQQPPTVRDVASRFHRQE